ncbi:MAG: redoxin domain-containing protein [Flavobacteriaceae bacterium]
MSIQKNLILLIICTCIFLSCEQAVEKGNKLLLNFNGASGTYVLTQLKADGEFESIDSTEAKSGQALFKNIKPNWYLLRVPGKQISTPIFMENSDLTITGGFSSDQNLIEGSVAQSDYSMNLNKLKKENPMGEIIKRRQEAIKVGDTIKAQMEMELLLKAKKEYGDLSTQLIDDYIMNHPKSVLSAFYLWTESYKRSPQAIQKMEQWLKNIELDSIPSMVYMNQLISRVHAVDLGSTAHDFTQQDTDGNPIKLSDIYSKHRYTLIDFWASSCGPCKAEYPHMIKSYKEYSDKGFTIFGISLDSKKQQWLDAIEKEGLNWIHVSDLEGAKNQAALLYGITGIPFNLLVDSNGKIIAKDLRKEKLHQTLTSLMNEKKAQN